MKTQEQMLNELLDSESHLITKHERQWLDVCDLKDRPMDRIDMEKLIEIYDRVFLYGAE